MSEFVLLTDSAADIPAKELAEGQIEIMSPKESSSTSLDPFAYTDPFLNTFLSIR